MRRCGSLPWKKALLESRWAGRGPGKKSREPRTLRFEPLEVRMLLSVTITANKPNATLQPLANGEFTVTESVAPSSSETINFQLSGTATYGTDFTVQVPSGSYNSNNHTGTVVVTHTQTTATIDIVPVNNRAAAELGLGGSHDRVQRLLRRRRLHDWLTELGHSHSARGHPGRGLDHRHPAQCQRGRTRCRSVPGGDHPHLVRRH